MPNLPVSPSTGLAAVLLTVAFVLRIMAEPPVEFAPTALQHNTIIVDNHHVHYRIGGRGPYLLLLHGFTLTGSEWEPFVETLTRTHTVIIPDLPGHGHSTRLAGGFTYGRTAEIIDGLLDSLGVKTVKGIGHSAGSITLLTMAVRRPGRLESLVLVAGAHRLSERGVTLLAEETFQTLDETTLDFYRTLQPGGDMQIASIFDQMNAMARSQEWTAYLDSHLAAIEIPVYLVGGSEDQYFPPDVLTELRQRLSNSSLRIVEGQGHAPVFEQLGGSAEAAAQLLQDLPDFWAKRPVISSR